MSFIQDLIESIRKPKKRNPYVRDIVAGTFYKVSDWKSVSSVQDIGQTIDTMRALAEDSQIDTALSYYATDATTPNSSGDIIWATPKQEQHAKTEPAELVNALFRRWKVNNYARDHILELATIGNLYIPTTDFFRTRIEKNQTRTYVGLDTNKIPDNKFDIVPSHKIRPEDVLHIWNDNEPYGYIHDLDEESGIYTSYEILPEESIVHFSLGGLVGDYKIPVRTIDGEESEYDIQFAKPLLKSAVQPTQTLNLLEDSVILSSLIKVIRFVCVECNGVDESEITDTLVNIKNIIEQQMSLNTDSGDAQSFLNPQSPNNLIYLPKVNNQEPISIIDMNMKDNQEGTDFLLDHFQNKKLSVLGIPKEALNFSSAEGLGGAGSVMSQRSSLYANSLLRIETAYMNGWRDAINKYLEARNLSGYVDQYELHMNPILTELSGIQFEKRDAALNQAISLLDLLGQLNVEDTEIASVGLSEILDESLPKVSSELVSNKIDLSAPVEEMM